jgi:DNA transformation protein and related proteins
MSGKPENKTTLSTLPNIGPEVARLLAAAGIRSPRHLQRLGAVNAALRIAQLRPHDPPCRSMLAGLQGAIRGIRWHAIPQPDREALWQVYHRRLAAAPPAPKTRNKLVNIKINM